MRVARLITVFGFCVSYLAPCVAQQPAATSSTAVLRDPQAISVMQSALNAMGSSVPGDSSATGTVTITAGSETDSGTITILTHGSTQSVEQVATGNGTQKTVFSDGLANDSSDMAAKTSYSLELAASSQSTVFPLPLLSAIRSSPDSALQYVGLENIGDVACHHIQVWNTYASRPDLQFLSPFSYREIWIDAKTGLPLKLAYAIREGSGATASTAAETVYSSYQNVGGVLYPFQVSRSLNGTPWMTISITSVSFNTGLTASTFSIF
jgi:hypothetical protein